MSDFALDRIKEQLKKQPSIPREELLKLGAGGGFEYKPTIISPEELQDELNNLFQISEPIKEEIIVTSSNIKEFPDLFHFVEWFIVNEEKFNERQKAALKTLVEARDLINVGCACKRQQRLAGATNYFQIFWQNNIKNDLLETVLKACQTEEIIFGDFLRYPTPK